jgi:putative exosortase-associated protein (TIGR04073 family)
MTYPAAASLALGLALAMAMVWISPVQAEEPVSLETQISKKFVRGIVNLSTGWMELPRQVYEVGQNEGWVTGVLRGPFDGIGMFFARTVAGVVEIATFPVPLPTYQPILSPAYAWESERVDDVVTPTAPPRQ